MALSAPAYRKFHGHQDEITSVLAASDTYYMGGIIVANGSGEGAVASAIAENQTILGILTDQYAGGERVDELTLGSGENKTAVLRRGKVWLSHTGAAQTDVGGIFVPSDDDTMDDVPATAAKRYIGYVALEYDSGKGLLFDLRAPTVVDNET